MNYVKKIFLVCNFWRVLIVLLIVNTLDKNYTNMIYREVTYWGKLCKVEFKNKFVILAYLLVLGEKSYRNLLYYRIGVKSRIRSQFFKLFFPIMNTLFISVDELGECFFIQHGFATIITAKKIGDYCWINQQVTVGWKDETGCPVCIGNGVRISAGAKVLGPIEIGNNAIIGANAVVIRDVADNQIVGGVPAKVIGTNNNRKLWDDINISEVVNH